MTAPLPEQRLLLDCTIRQLSPEGAPARGRARAADLDWDLVMRLAAEHRVIPMLARQAAHITAIPATARRSLEGASDRRTVRSIEMTGELLGIIGAFDAAGISSLPFKGPVLSQYAYGDVGMRHSDDLDVFVPDAHLPGALAVLERRGYQLPHARSPRRRALLASAFGHHAPTHPTLGLTVELHPRLVDRRFGFPVTGEQLLARSEALTLAGRSVRTLGRDDLILYLCVHGAKHIWRRLEWIATLAQVMRAGPVDYPTLLRLADALGARRRLLLGVHLAHVLVEAPLPDDARRAIGGDPAIADLAACAIQRLFPPSGLPLPKDETLSLRLRFHAASLDRLSDRAYYLYHSLVLPSDAEVEALDLPDRLTFLYYPFRALRLASRAVTRRARH